MGCGMRGVQASGKLVELLGAATEGLCGWLSDALPKLDQAWWSSLVLSNLSYQQRERVERQGIDSLWHLELLDTYGLLLSLRATNRSTKMRWRGLRGDGKYAKPVF